MCPWCDANDTTVPFTDVSSTALWKQTVNRDVPYTLAPPLAKIPGAADSRFLSKDVFHICNLGITRTFVVSTICFLVLCKHFESRCNLAGKSVPVRLNEAYQLFAEFCQHVVHETPLVKHFTRENLGWGSLHEMPEASFKASDVRLMLRWLVSYLQRPFVKHVPLDYVTAAATGPCMRFSMSSCCCCCCSCLLGCLYVVHVCMREEPDILKQPAHTNQAWTTSCASSLRPTVCT